VSAEDQGASEALAGDEEVVEVQAEAEAEGEDEFEDEVEVKAKRAGDKEAKYKLLIKTLR
jgi:hypothetical protein